MRVKARPGIGKMERIFGYIWLQQCECMWICLSECIEILNVFCTLILFVCRLDQISSLQIDLTQPKRWSIFSKRSNELVICAKILVSEVSGNSLWSHLSLQLHISLHLPVYLTAHPPKAGDAYQNLVIKFDEPGKKSFGTKWSVSHFHAHGLVVTSRVPVIEDFTFWLRKPDSLVSIGSSLKPDGHHALFPSEFSWIPYHDVVMRYGIIVCLPFPSNRSKVLTLKIHHPDCRVFLIFPKSCIRLCFQNAPKCSAPPILPPWKDAVQKLKLAWSLGDFNGRTSEAYKLLSRKKNTHTKKINKDGETVEASSHLETKT